MTRTYLGNNMWNLIFSDGVKVTLGEKHIHEIIDGSKEIFCKKKEQTYAKVLDEQAEKQSGN